MAAATIGISWIFVTIYVLKGTYDQYRQTAKETQASQNPPPPEGPLEPNTTNTTNQQRSPDNKPPTFDTRWSPEWAVVIVGSITLAFIGWQAWETRKTAKSAKSGLKHSREMLRTIQQGQRAWITLQVLRFDPPQRGQPLVILLTIENGGETPARIHDFKVAVWVQEQTRLWANWTPAFDYGPSRGHEAPRLLTAHERTRIRTVLEPVDGSFFAGNNNTLFIAGYVEYQLTKDATRHRRYGFARQYDRGLSHDEGVSKFRYASLDVHGPQLT